MSAYHVAVMILMTCLLHGTRWLHTLNKMLL